MQLSKTTTYICRDGINAFRRPQSSLKPSTVGFSPRDFLSLTALASEVVKFISKHYPYFAPPIAKPAIMEHLERKIMPIPFFGFAIFNKNTSAAAATAAKSTKKYLCGNAKIAAIATKPHFSYQSLLITPYKRSTILPPKKPHIIKVSSLIQEGLPMLLKYFYDDKLAQASYLLACPASGTAIVIDPARNIAPYLAAAKQHSLRIQYITETHIHADFLSGIRELAHATGATMLLSGEGGNDWSYNFPEGDKFQLLHDGDTLMIGGVKLEVLHTAGHTPEHLSFMVTDTGANAPMGIFTGDFLFAGDLGRPDLLEEAAAQQGTREIGAAQQFQNIQRFKQLPDYLQIWPGHGAGSACGKALGAVPSTTLGYEKLFNPAFQLSEESAFIDWLLEGQPEAPKYFAQMKKVNKSGATLLHELPPLQKLEAMPENALIIDTRSSSEYAKGHWQGTINIPINSNSFPTYLGWYVDYEKPLYFIAHPNKLDEVLTTMRSIAVDNVAGYLSPESLSSEAKIVQKTPKEIYEAGYRILDVRAMSEYESEHIPNAMHIHMGLVPNHLDELPRDETLAVQCGGGLRSQVVVSILQKHGFTNVVNMKGGIDAWKNAKLPLEQN